MEKLGTSPTRLMSVIRLLLPLTSCNSGEGSPQNTPLSIQRLQRPGSPSLLRSPTYPYIPPRRARSEFLTLALILPVIKSEQTPPLTMADLLLKICLTQARQHVEVTANSISCGLWFCCQWPVQRHLSAVERTEDDGARPSWHEPMWN